MTTIDLEQAFKAKLRRIAEEKKCDPADLWQHLMIERFLVRLARSEYSQHFILKGATLLSRYINIGRETRDIDFLAYQISNEVGELQNIFQKVAKIDLKDGCVFQGVKAQVLPHPHMKYSGAEVSMTAFFGRTRFKVEIDIGFGDVVEPTAQVFPLTSYSKGPLFEESVEVLCYPKEFIFAEKLETIVYRGGANSRMKDFHDVYSLINFFKGESSLKIEESIRQVFLHRETSISFPIVYSREDFERLEAFWDGYIRGLSEEHRQRLPGKIEDVIAVVNKWVQNHTSLFA